MKIVMKKTVKILLATMFAAILLVVSPKSVKADAVTDAIAAQQAALYEQQVKAMQQYQALLIAQYQQAMADQYAKALLVFQQAQINQQNAIQQAYMLNAIQAQQNAQYQSMITNSSLDYQNHLMEVYKLYQQQVITAFKGYEGIK